MTDGNTAMSEAQVSPVSEEEMNHVSKIFQSVAQSIVDASKLGKDIASIKQEVARVQAEQDYLRQKNADQDALIADTRRQRDEAEAKVNEQAKEIEQLKQAASYHDSDVRNAQARIDSLEANNSTLRKERDDAAFKHLEVSDELSQLKTKWAKFENLVGQQLPVQNASVPAQPKTYADYNQPSQSPRSNW